MHRGKPFEGRGVMEQALHRVLLIGAEYSHICRHFAVIALGGTDVDAQPKSLEEEEEEEHLWNVGGPNLTTGDNGDLLEVEVPDIQPRTLMYIGAIAAVAAAIAVQYLTSGKA
eukprot:CAMPEP_0183333460 /NCGR_PEP_ID=MMETSP0164_2-20130417/2353_1 /TAXON_ID=221442 /ORGANISM="Coccolithus pelagicus ssp braarudi, Strain PLY182g" /LENGTH=112 /DNA_ID=CAMNT_0025502389 /DNA_START=26 /DNA_END=364 /DNA_ORIENTATION=-